jgi:uncharacterized protein (DUF4415 family)
MPSHRNSEESNANEWSPKISSPASPAPCYWTNGGIIAVPINFEMQTRELPVVWGLFKREQRAAELLSKPVSQIGGPTTRPIPRSISGVSNSGPHPSAPISSPKRRGKRVQVEGLFLEAEPEPLVHAKALLWLIQTQCPEKMGKYVPQSHLARTYQQMCAQNDWKPRHWTAIGRRLARLTDRRTVKRDRKRFRAYRIPKHQDKVRLEQDLSNSFEARGSGWVAR